MRKPMISVPDPRRVGPRDSKEHDGNAELHDDDQEADPAFVPRSYQLPEGAEMERLRTPCPSDDDGHSPNHSVVEIERNNAEYSTAARSKEYETAAIDKVCINPETSIAERVLSKLESQVLQVKESNGPQHVTKDNRVSILGRIETAEQVVDTAIVSPRCTNHEQNTLENDSASIVSTDSLDRELLEFHIIEANDCLEASDWNAAENCISKLLSNQSLNSDDRRNWGFKLAEVYTITEKWQPLLELVQTEGLSGGAADHLVAEAYLGLGNAKDASKLCVKAIKVKRKDAKHIGTLNDSMELMARIMDELGNDIEARFYRSKLPDGFSPARDRRSLTTDIQKERDKALSIAKKTLKQYNLSFDLANMTLDGTDKDIMRAWRKAMKHNLKDLTSLLLLDIPRLHSATSTPTADDKSPLHIAVRYDRIDAVKQLVSGTALHEAILDAKLDLVHLMITSGASLQLTDNEGWTPLHVAARFNSPEMVNILLENGSDVCSVSNEASTPLHLALENDNMRWSLEITKQLISYGSPINAPDDHGWTPLHCAARFGTEETTRCLLDAGTNDSALTNIGSSPLHMAIRNAKHSVQIAKLLHSRGLCVDQRNHDGMTPLQIAARHSTWESVLCLDELGADTSVRTNSGRTLLHLAVYNKRDPAMIIRLLLLWGSKIDESDAQGWTALHIACITGTVVVVQCLLEHRADVRATTKLSLETPLHMTAHRKDDAVAAQIARLLIENGAEIDAEDENGDTPLRLARTWRRKGLERVLKEHYGNLKQGRTSRVTSR